MLHTYVPASVEYRLAFHCAPVLAGLKPANLITLSKRKDDLCGGLAEHLERMRKNGIYSYPLVENARWILLLVYHEKRLTDYLSQPAVREFLISHGYRPGEMDLPFLLKQLSRRLQSQGGGYPHEIGVFLGYPLQDIQGFIRHGGNACKLCGYWKVYGDAEQAKHIFAAFDAARQFYCQRVLCGEAIHTIQYGGCYS